MKNIATLFVCGVLCVAFSACQKKEVVPPPQEKLKEAVKVVPQNRVVQDKNDIQVERNGTILIIRDLNYSLQEALSQEAIDIGEIETLALVNCDVREFSNELQLGKNVTSLIMRECILHNLNFLPKMPQLESVYAFHVSYPRSSGYLDLSQCEHLVFFYIDGMNFNIEFGRIKGIPKSLRLFSSDALFDKSNLPELQAQGNPDLYFDVNTYDTEELVAQGVKFGSNPDDYRYFKEKYHFDIR